MDEAFYNLVREIRKYNKDQQYGNRPLNGPESNGFQDGTDDSGSCCCVTM